MPELPEVETIKQELQPLLGTQVNGVEVKDRLLLGEGTTEPVLEERVCGKEISKLDRYGKYCLFEISEVTLLFSLRMTGNLLLDRGIRSDSDSYIAFDLGETNFLFTSIRRFSNLHCFDTVEFAEIEKLQKLGPDPLRTNLTAGDLERIFSNRTAPVKSALMNQECIAGLGNIYANEICHFAEIDPRRGIDQLSSAEFELLSEALQDVLNLAIESGGSSISDFTNSKGNEGSYQNSFRVYGRDGERCDICSSIISKETLSGRSTFWCSVCQS